MTEPNDNRTSMIVKEQLGSELTQQNEIAANAVAAAARADIESRFILAKKFPRDLDVVREALIKECKRPGFASTAIYRKPIGNVKNPRTGQWEEGYVEGLSVRFAEAALRHMRNVYVSVVAIYDDRAKTIQRITVMDLESVSTIAVDITVAKQVERSKLKKDQEAIEVRRNSAGQTVYVVAAGDDQVNNKVNAAVSKTLRNGLLRLLPGDIADECEALCRSTMLAKDAADPDAAKRAIFDSFAGIGVSVEKIKTFLGHDAATLQPAELAQLRALFAAIRDGETTWNAVVGDAAEAAAEAGDQSAQANVQKKVADLVEQQRQKKAGNAPKPEPAKEDRKSDPPPAAKSEPAATGNGNRQLTEAELLAAEVAENERLEREAGNA